MTTVASSLLDFILSLFSDDEAAARYAKDPEGELERAGLHGVKPADVDDVRNMESDYSPVSFRGHGRDDDHCDDDRPAQHGGWKNDDDDKGHHAPVRHDYQRDDDKCDDDDDDHHGHKAVRDDDDHHGHKPVRDDDDHHGHKPVRHDDHDDDTWNWDDKRDDRDGHHHKEHEGSRGNHEHNGGQETAVIQHVENHYSYTDIDVEIEHAVIAGGDAYAIWGEDVLLATGNGVALGEDAELDIEARDIVVGDGNVVNSDLEGVGNTNSNVATGHGTVEDNDTEISGDDNIIGHDNVEGDGNATASGFGIANADNSTDVDIDLENSLNKVDGDFQVSDVEVGDVEDSTLSLGVAGDDLEQETTSVESEIENSIVGQNAVAGEEAGNEFEYEEDNSVQLDVQVDDIVTGDNSAGDDLEQELDVEVDDSLVLVITDATA
jgi:hypothetical protein